MAYDSIWWYVPTHTRAQSTVDFPIGGHVNVLSDYKETGPEKKFILFKYISGSLKMHACVLTFNIDQTEHAFLHSQGHVRKNG